MKNLTLLLLIPIIGASQLPSKNLKLLDGKFYFEKVYEMKGLDSMEITNLLLTKFPSLKYNQENFTVDYKKLGYTTYNTAPIISTAEQFFSVNIQVKDEKYRVLTTNHKYRMTVDLYGSILGISDNDNSLNSWEEVCIRRNGNVKQGSSTQGNLLMLSESLNDYFGKIEEHASLVNADW